MDEIIRKLKGHRLFTVGYADDLAILTTGCFENTLGNLMKTAFKIMVIIQPLEDGTHYVYKQKKTGQPKGPQTFQHRTKADQQIQVFRGQSSVRP